MFPSVIIKPHCDRVTKVGGRVMGATSCLDRAAPPRIGLHWAVPERTYRAVGEELYVFILYDCSMQWCYGSVDCYYGCSIVLTSGLFASRIRINID